ncbi:MAG: efflux RND transporter periplasmic adaptor subunit [Deltaproteobacteria bacterium]|nr:efflux RND transporter periplasmic adaptor subunit [Deltaproteobacteria bacterium]
MKKLLLIVLLLAGIAGGYLGYKRFYTKPGMEILETAKVEKGSIRGVLVETGIIKPQVGAVVKIGSRITGIVVKMHVKIGDRVQKGQLIAQVDDRELRKSIDRQKAALEAARSTLEQVQLTYPNRIREAQANFHYARVTFEREQALLKEEYTTADAVDRAKSQFKATEANLGRLQDEYKTQLEISKGRVEEAEAQLKQLEVNLSYTRITSPIDGVVSDVTIQEGETIVTGLQVANLVTVLDPTLLDLWIYVDETNIGKAQVGQKVEYYVDAFPERIFKGKVGKIYPQPVTKDNIVYYLAIVEVSKEDTEYLKPEMTSQVRIIFQEKEGILTVPNAAVKFAEGKQVAYKVSGPNKADKVVITTGIRGEDRTEILSGIQEGDEVATRIVLPMAPKS